MVKWYLHRNNYIGSWNEMQKRKLDDSKKKYSNAPHNNDTKVK